MSSFSTLAKIKRHFVCVPRGQMIASRDLLKHGKRSKVDNAIYHLIHKERLIWRVARGVFIRAGSPWPTEAEIAAFKAKAFNRILRIHGNDSACRFNLDTKRNEKTTYYIDSASSSFGNRYGRIHFKGISKKRICLEDDAVGTAIRAIWARGEKSLKVTDIFNRSMPWAGSREKFTQVIMNKQWMPAWLGDKFLTAAYLGPPPLRYDSTGKCTNWPPV